MCASTRSRPNKRAAVAYASGFFAAAQPTAPADKKPAAVRRPIAGPTGVPGPTVPTVPAVCIRPTGVPGRTVPAIRPMATVLEIVGTSKADRGRRCEEHSCCGKEVLVEDVVVRLRREQILVPNRLGSGYREETAYTVNWVTDGQDRCRVGFLPRAYVAQGGLFDGVLCQVVSIGNAFDDDHI